MRHRPHIILILTLILKYNLIYVQGNEGNAIKVMTTDKFYNIADKDIEENQIDIGKWCKDNKCVPKCCGKDEYLIKRQCKKDKTLENLDFSDVLIYDKNIRETGKSLKDVYTLVPGRLFNETFYNTAYDYTILDHKYYLTEDNILYEETPHNTWLILNSSQFCVDYQLVGKTKAPEARFWTVLEVADSLKNHPLIREDLALEDNKKMNNEEKNNFSKVREARAEPHRIEDAEHDFDEICRNYKCIPKCCGKDEYVGKRRTCKLGKRPEKLDFSDVPIYYNKNYKTRQSLKDVFVVRPGRFLNATFKEKAYDYTAAGHNDYLSEDGILYQEVPNEYKRWYRLDGDNFCVDYLLPNKRIKVPTPRFWTIMESDDILEDHPLITAGLLVSCVFLMMVFLVYSLLPELRNLGGMVLMSYVASLFGAFLLLAVIQIGSHWNTTCLGLTYSVYFCFLASFCWMNVMSLDIWWTFRGYAKARPIHRRGERFKFGMYSLYAWGVPVALTIMLAALNNVNMKHLPWFVTPNLLSRGCFIQGEAKLLYLYTPMLILILCNWAFFLMTAFNLWRLHRSTAVLDSAAAGTPAAHRTQRHRLMVYLKLSIIMGINWVLEVISSFKPNLKMWYLSDAYNLLVGVSIFLIFVCKWKIWRMLMKRYGRYSNWGRRSQYSKSHSSHTTESDASQEAPLKVCGNPKGPLYYDKR